MHSLQYTMYSVECTVYGVHYTVYSVYCDTVKCTLYTHQYSPATDVQLTDRVYLLQETGAGAVPTVFTGQRHCSARLATDHLTITTWT